jgi:predicted  nucleic acid-binding Zn-ribbon protein
MAAVYHNADTIRDLMAEVRLCHKQIAALKDQLQITQGERDHWKREARAWQDEHAATVYAYEPELRP